MSFKTLDTADVAGKRALLRLDLNVPMENGRVTDATRIDRALPTVRELAAKGARTIILSHFGRPKNGPDVENSLRPIAAALASHLGAPVAFASDCVGAPAADAIAAMKNGDVLLLENTRFHKGEEKNDPAFVAELAKLGDIYVNDAFSAAHRAHASTEGVAHKMPAYAGRNMQAELEALTAARKIIDEAAAAKCQIVLPVDVVVAREFKAHAPSRVVDVDHVGDDEMILDAGPKSVVEIEKLLGAIKTLVWNGPFGAFEMQPFDAGTNAVARAAAALTDAGELLTVAGGGDTVSALNQAGVAQRFTYISTAGGAFLEWLEGKSLPGVEALRV